MGALTYHVGCEDEDPLVLAAGPLGVVQKVGVVLQGVPRLTPCKQKGALSAGSWLSPTQAGAEPAYCPGGSDAPGVREGLQTLEGKHVLTSTDALPHPHPGAACAQLLATAWLGRRLGVSSLPRGRTLTPHPKPSSVWTEDCGLECDAAATWGLWQGWRGRTPSRPVRVPSSVPAGTDLGAAGLFLDPGGARGTLGRGWGGRPWPSVLCATRALVGYRNLA